MFELRSEAPFAPWARLDVPRGGLRRPVVCVQGLGFVGAAMAAAVAQAEDGGGAPLFDVVGVDLDTDRGRAAVDEVNAGRFPFDAHDDALVKAVETAARAGNLRATTDPGAYAAASVILVDVNFDLDPTGTTDSLPPLELAGFRAAIRTIGEHMAPGTLVIVETTVPPGTCEKLVAPELSAALSARGFDGDDFLLAHSYERVMPGAGYLDSIVNYWRVYAGHTEAAADACAAFLARVIDVERYPLTRLTGTTASETAKVLENSYRAVNIALIEEWRRFTDAVGTDLFAIVGAIRMRPTHSNIREPGFGVGGYCLPKDPLLAAAAARVFYGRDDLDFPFCRMAVSTNGAMPEASLALVERLLGGSVSGRRILLLGVSYRPDVADTRFSPAEVFVRAAEQRGAVVVAHDPLVRHWPEAQRAVLATLPDPRTFDALLFAVPHREYRTLDIAAWIGEGRPAVVDASNVLTAEQRSVVARLRCPTAVLGRGEWRP